MKNIPLFTENLAVGYGDNKVLQGIGLSSKKGELVCLLGANGSGKSTLLRTLAGLQKSLEGDIFLDNSSIDDLPASEKSIKLSVTLSHAVISGNLTVRELVELGRYPHVNMAIRFTKEDDDHVAQALELTGITELAGQLCHELSDGQLQKAFIARAVAQDTPVMLLDEPANHLDLGARLEVIRLLSRLAKEKNRTVIMSTHHLDLAVQLADVLWVITKEGTVKTGVPEDLFLSGTIQRAFPVEQFDLTSGKVVYPKGPRDVAYEGNNPWVRQALQRNGFNLSEKNTGKGPSVASTESAEGTTIEVNDGNVSYTVNTIAEMLELLQRRD